VPLRKAPTRSSQVVARIGRVDDAAVVEAGYEIPAAVVYARRGTWLLLRTHAGVEGWIEQRDRGTYYTIESLLRRGLLYLTRAWDRRILETPNGKPLRIPENVERRVVGVLNWITPSVTTRGTEAEATRRGCSFSGHVGVSEGLLECPAAVQLQLHRAASGAADIHSTFNTASGIPLVGIGHEFVVFEAVPGWYQVAVGDVAAYEKVWMAAGPDFSFRPARTREERERLAAELWREDPALELRETRWDNGMLWLKIDLLSTSACNGDPSRVIASGWIPAYAPSNDLTTWFYARGC
jgi:hypothetical protein